MAPYFAFKLQQTLFPLPQKTGLRSVIDSKSICHILPRIDLVDPEYLFFHLPILKEEIVQQQCQTILLYTLQINPQPKIHFLRCTNFHVQGVIAISGKRFKLIFIVLI